MRFISTYQSVLVISKYEYRNIYMKKRGQSLSYSILSNDYSIPSNQKSSESYFYILFLFNIIITSFLPATTPAGNHIIPSAIKMHYHSSQTIVHITLNLILMKRQEIWQQTSTSFHWKNKRYIAIFTNHNIQYNRYKCINKTCLEMKNTKLALLSSQAVMQNTILHI